LNAVFVALRELPWAPRENLMPVCFDAATVLDMRALKTRMAVFAGWLERQSGPRVAICLDDPFDFACALFAVLACGKEPVIPSVSTPAYLAMLGDCYDVLLTAAQLPELERWAPAALRMHAIDAAAPLTLYTSGSSGTPKAVRKTLAQFDAEVRTPRELLERRLPVHVRHYAFPYGDANDAVLEALARQQYQLGVTVNPGGNAFYAQPLMLHRTMIFGDVSLDPIEEIADAMAL